MRSMFMRLALGIISMGFLTQCTPWPQSSAPAAPHPHTPRATTAASVTTPPAMISSPLIAPSVTQSAADGIRFVGISFDSRNHRLIVADQSRGPGSEFPDAASAAATFRGIAAANAGFFTPTGDPLGLVIASGNRAGTWNSTSSLGSGIWCSDRNGQARITRREALSSAQAYAMQDLIQAGPMLVNHHRPVAGLEATKSRVRTFLLWDGGSRWWLGMASPCSLAQLATTLSIQAPTSWRVQHALNLDGGSSSDLWISGNINGGPINQRGIWNRPVRNFLVVTPR